MGCYTQRITIFIKDWVLQIAGSAMGLVQA